MRGCSCATCEGQRAYAKRPDVRERRAANERRRYQAQPQASYERKLATNRAWLRHKAERRDTETINRLRRAA